MMRIRLNSKILHAFLVGRVLLFLFWIFPVFGFAAIGGTDQIKDSLANNSSAKIYISEGTTIYNNNDIYSVDNSNSITETAKKHTTKKNIAVSKSLEKKSKKPSQYLQHTTIPVITEHFNCLPVEPVSFFSKNNNRSTVSLPVNQQQIKIIGIMTHYFFSVSTEFKNKNSSVYLTIINGEAYQWQIHTRPPPYNI